MRITPRSEEVAEIVAALGASEYGTDKERERIAAMLGAGKYATPEGKAEIVEMLESGEFEGPEEMAEALIQRIAAGLAAEVTDDLIAKAAEVAIKGVSKGVIKHAADLLWFRESYVLGVQLAGEPTVAFGVFFSEAEAKTYGKEFEGMLVPNGWGVLKVHGMGVIAANAAGGREGGGFGYCATEGCGCPPYAHSMSGTSRGKCIVCKVCPEYTQAEAKKATRKRKVTA